EVQSQRTLVRFETRVSFHAYKPFTHDLAPPLKYKARHVAKRSSSPWQESLEENRTPHEPLRHGLARICGSRLIRRSKLRPEKRCSTRPAKSSACRPRARSSAAVVCPKFPELPH